MLFLIYKITRILYNFIFQTRSKIPNNIAKHDLGPTTRFCHFRKNHLLAQSSFSLFFPKKSYLEDSLKKKQDFKGDLKNFGKTDNSPTTLILEFSLKTKNQVVCSFFVNFLVEKIKTRKSICKTQDTGAVSIFLFNERALTASQTLILILHSPTSLAK